MEYVIGVIRIERAGNRIVKHGIVLATTTTTSAYPKDSNDHSRSHIEPEEIVEDCDPDLVLIRK
jgi:uncharacterized protein YbjT (DUF2867 family)